MSYSDSYFGTYLTARIHKIVGILPQMDTLTHQSPPYVPRPGTKIPKLSNRERYMLNELLEVHRYAIRMRQMVRPRFLRGTSPQHDREIRDLYALAHAIAKDEGIEYIKREIG